MIHYCVEEINFYDDYELALNFEKSGIKQSPIEVKQILSLYCFNEFERIYNLLGGKALFYIVYQKEDTEEIINDYNCSLNKDNNNDSWIISGDNYKVSLQPEGYYAFFHWGKKVRVKILGISYIDIL